MSSTVSMQAQALAESDRVAEAFAMLNAALGQGDAEAALTLAQWRLSGQHIRRDLAQSRELFGKAADLGLEAAEPIYLALLANGAGGTGRRWADARARLSLRARRDTLARQQCALLDAMALDDEGNPLAIPAAVPLHSAPYVARLPGFMTDEECSYLAARALPQLQPAVVIHPQTGQFIQDPIRRSLVAAFPFVAEDLVIHAINRRIAAATGLAWEAGEPTQVLAYDPGGEYKLHSDALPGGPGVNQRVQTLLVTLDDRFDGGETMFPRLGITWRGAVGEALLFHNTDASGGPEPLAWHAGQPVRRGRKLLLSKWLRAAPLDLAGPAGRPF